MEASTDGSEDDGKPNICPVCCRRFRTVAGLRQHWTKSHSLDEINDIITSRSQQFSQQSVSIPVWDSGPLNTTRPERTFKNTFQILKKDNETTEVWYHQFEIIEKDATGDCLFSSVLEFMRLRKDVFPIIPKDILHLRSMVVNHILKSANDVCQSNFDRFQFHLIENLQDEIPSFASDDTPIETLKSDYANYMSTPKKYGTTAELCAMAEIFSFGFCVIRANNHSSYHCYDYGSINRTTNLQTNEVVHLLFTGNAGNGHFKLLKPSKESLNIVTQPGAYQLIKDFSSPGFTSIAPLDFIETNNDAEENRTPTNDDDNATIPKTSFKDAENLNPADFVKLLSRCKRNVKVLKRIPRGARILAANKLKQCIDDCLANPKADKKWEKLLTFAYTSLQVPSKTRNVSLTTLVKKNIGSEVLNIPQSSTSNKRVPISISRRVEYKISDGDVKGAVKILSSMEALAPQNKDTLDRLILKHPPPTNEFQLPNPPDANVETLVVSEQEVYKKIGSFSNGSGAGVDGILPQHLKDMTSTYTGEAGLLLLRSITKLTNFMLAGKMPSKLCEIFYGASLCALTKEDGGIRPIAVGNTFRRLTSKLACASVRMEMATSFAPRQVGFGITGGCEAAAHATRTFMKKHKNTRKAIVKIDFRNAFNEIDRDKFLEEMKSKCPAIYPFLWQCYSAPTLLFFGEDTIRSQNGAQQGDPCGPLLFCSAIQAVVEALISEFVAFYLDDGLVAGDYESVLQDFNTIVVECGKIGLHVNTAKCELYFCSEVDQEIVNGFNEIAPGIKVVTELTLLGAPISENAVEGIFNKKWIQMQVLFARLLKLDNNHIAFYLLKNCFCIPKLVYLLRVSPTENNRQIIELMDAGITSTLEAVINSKLDESNRIVSSLPVRNGGLGVRRIQDIAFPAFLSSINSVSEMIKFMLQTPTLDILDIADYGDGLMSWNALNPETELPKLLSLQKQWDAVNVNRLSNVLQFDTDEDKARLLAICRPESSAWLYALPSRSIGTLLENNVFRIIVSLRLGLDICVAHTCICGSKVERNGRHGLSCRKSAGRFARHAELNLIIKKALASADIPSRLEPPGLYREDGKRVDGLSMVPWSRGSSLIWDATCTDTLAPSNVKSSSREAGKAAENRARVKENKYRSLIDQNYHFVPFSVETLGPWSSQAMKFFNELCKKITSKTNEPRTRSFLQQRISMAIQRMNAASIMGTFLESETEKMEEIFYLL